MLDNLVNPNSDVEQLEHSEPLPPSEQEMERQDVEPSEPRYPARVEGTRKEEVRFTERFRSGNVRGEWNPSRKRSSFNQRGRAERARSGASFSRGPSWAGLGRELPTTSTSGIQ